MASGYDSDDILEASNLDGSPNPIREYQSGTLIKLIYPLRRLLPVHRIAGHRSSMYRYQTNSWRWPLSAYLAK